MIVFQTHSEVLPPVRRCHNVGQKFSPLARKQASKQLNSSNLKLPCHRHSRRAHHRNGALVSLQAWWTSLRRGFPKPTTILLGGSTKNIGPTTFSTCEFPAQHTNKNRSNDHFNLKTPSPLLKPRFQRLARKPRLGPTAVPGVSRQKRTDRLIDRSRVESRGRVGDQRDKKHLGK